MMTKHTADEIASATNLIRETFPRGATVTTLVKHVTRSGMSRSILVLKGNADGTVTDVSWAVARVLGWKFDGEHGGVKVQGVGMDMTFHLTYTLSSHLYGAGDALSHHSL